MNIMIRQTGVGRYSADCYHSETEESISEIAWTESLALCDLFWRFAVEGIKLTYPIQISCMPAPGGDLGTNIAANLARLGQPERALRQARQKTYPSGTRSDHNAPEPDDESSMLESFLSLDGDAQ